MLQTISMQTVTINVPLDLANIIGRNNRYLWQIDGHTLTQDDARRAPSLSRRRYLVFVRVMAVKM